jgi:predicted acetyltransferase
MPYDARLYDARPYEVRPLTEADAGPAWQLGALAFGYEDRAMPPDWTPVPAGRCTYGAFAGDRLVGKASDREQGHFFGGVSVRSSGVLGVAVEPEQRGRGVARLMLTALLAGARERGALVSTLFPTTPHPYRALGWEECGALTWTAIPTATLAGIVVPQGLRLRPATAADEPALLELYRRQAGEGTAMIDRNGPFWSVSFRSHFDGVSVVEDATNTIVGYASWWRGPGYRDNARVTVDDFVATTPQATQALLAMLGAWAPVAPTIVLKMSTVDCVAVVTAGLHGHVEDRRPWMLRLVDAAGAVAARGWSAHISGTVELELVDRECPWNAGCFRLVLDAGQARLEPGGSGGTRLGPRGLALWYAGAASPNLLRRAGLLSGDASGDALLAVATAGPAPQLLDYF